MQERSPVRAISAIATLTLAILFSGGVIPAHEFWIEPPPDERLAEGEALFELRVGDGFPGETFPRDPRHLVTFAAFGPAGRLEVPGRNGDSPAGRLPLVDGGTWVAAYSSSPNRIELEGSKFQAYLREEGLEAIADRREAAGDATRVGRESYRRCAKTVWSVGAPSGSTATRPVGLEFEIVPDRDPTVAAVGDELPLVVLLDGRPLAGVTLHAFVRGERSPMSRGVTDTDGRAVFVLDRPGVWMISGVQMSRASDEAWGEWSSAWTSLTFRVPPARARGID